MQEMQEVFGDVDDLLEMYAERKATAMLGREEDVDQQESMDPAIEEDPEAMAAFEERQACSSNCQNRYACLSQQNCRMQWLKAAHKPDFTALIIVSLGATACG